MQFRRFLRHGAVTAAAMARHAGALTAQRVAGREVVAIQDTSELVLGGRRARAAGYGAVGKGGALGGLLLHPVLAGGAGPGGLAGPGGMQGGDPPAGRVPPPRPAARAAQRAASAGPRGVGREVWGGPDGRERINWRLLTTHIVTAPAQAHRVIDVYRRRWIIEEFFRTLKTAGFDIEAADIGEPQAMINFVAAATIAAVTVKQLVQARDGNTDQHLTDAFDPDDQPILEAVSTKLARKTERQCNPHPKGSLAFAAWVIARLGGWTGYYGKPGPQGMRRRLPDIRAIKYGTTLALHDV